MSLDDDDPTTYNGLVERFIAAWKTIMNKFGTPNFYGKNIFRLEQGRKHNIMHFIII